MHPPYLHTVYKLSTTRNKYGDYIGSSETALTCHFREINELQHTGTSDMIQSDAMGWFEPDSGIERGDIIKFEGTHYKVERLTKARKLRNPNVQFIKVDFMKYGQIS